MVAVAREQFAEVYTGDAGGDGTEAAANFNRCLRFGVEGFVLGGATTEIEPDDAFRAAEGGGKRRRTGTVSRGSACVQCRGGNCLGNDL
jgi:hypothetical protein